MGFAIGLERLLALAGEDGYAFPEKPRTDVYVIGLGNVGTAPLAIAKQARDAGYSAVANFAQRSLKAQFKSADRLHARYIVIAGEEELKNGTVNIKDTDAKTQETVAVNDLIKTLKEREK